MTATTVTMASRVRAADDVLFRNLEGEAVLVGLKTSCYFGLDPVGTRIWELLAEHERLDAVLAGVVAEFEVDRATAEADLLRLIGELAAQGLVVVEQGK